MGFAIVKGWRILSLILATALAVSVSFNAYQGIGSNGNSANSNDDGLHFTFTWSPESQNITEGELRIDVSFLIEGENMTVIIKVNDDDYRNADNIGVVFDSNHDGVINICDYSYGLFAVNKTLPSMPSYGALLCYTLGFPEPAYQEISFDEENGYVFTIRFPPKDIYHKHKPNPVSFLEKRSFNLMRVCFEDTPYGMAVAVDFLVYYP